MTSASHSGVVGDGEGEIVARLSTDEWVVVQVRGHAWIASLLYILLLFFVILKCTYGIREYIDRGNFVVTLAF